MSDHFGRLCIKELKPPDFSINKVEMSGEHERIIRRLSF